MRKDMAKVIVERPRFKPWRLDNPKPSIDIDTELPAFVGIRRPYEERNQAKELNENLAPLRRYLFKQVGRPWDKVYGEISAHLRADNPVQQHVRNHLRDFVETVPDPKSYFRQKTRDAIHSGRPLFVDPQTGLLCRSDEVPQAKAARRARANKPKPPIDRVRLSDEIELQRIDGLWFEVRLAPVPTPEYRVCEMTVQRKLGFHPNARSVALDLKIRRLISAPVRDLITGKLIPLGPPVDTETNWRYHRFHHPERHYAVSKRSLSHKELKRHGLT